MGVEGSQHYCDYKGPPGSLFPAEKADTALLCGRGDVRLLAMLCVEFFSAAASSDPEMMYCKERWWAGRGGERGREEGRLLTWRSDCEEAVHPFNCFPCTVQPFLMDSYESIK